jgi:hypothetical protein
MRQLYCNQYSLPNVDACAIGSLLEMTELILKIAQKQNQLNRQKKPIDDK